MHYKSESILERFVKWVAKLVLNVVVVGLVLLVTVQFIMSNTAVDKSLLSKVPYSKYILKLDQSDKFSQTAKTVFAPQEGTLIFKLQGNDNPWQVRLLVNKEVVGNFAAGFIKVKVRPGDKLAIDARGYKEAIWLQLSDISEKIVFLKEGQQFWIKNEYKKLGTVKAKAKF
ncbi:hypothetical protein [Halanaerobacter jeridensis]|uniref:Uncharacterized protein n=1 Tax=Halanaerobacter jeridensis TaxID=706427 RepID=A0A938XP28_9FIRM|nr:hypothetical protein [Halanaerobacter jeridensis]MBM7556483.1 hypothetical protein [Halanaerobacter jeridensis]